MADHFILVHGYSKAEALILSGQALQFAIGPIAILFLAWKMADLAYNANEVTSLLAQNTLRLLLVLAITCTGGTKV